MNENEDPVSRKRRLANQRKKRWQENQSQESRAKIRALNAASQQERINKMIPEQLTAHHVHAASQHQYIERMTAEQSAVYNVAHNSSQQRYIDGLKPQQLKTLQYCQRCLSTTTRRANAP